jgi:hypothetical protein
MIDICFDCIYYADGMCTQYDIVVAPTDGCSNGNRGIVPIILIDKKGEEHDGLMDMRRMLIYLHNIPTETAISLGYTWKLAESEGGEKDNGD